MMYLPQLTMPLSHLTRPLSLLTKKKFQPTTHQKLQRLQLPPTKPQHIMHQRLKNLLRHHPPPTMPPPLPMTYLPQLTMPLSHPTMPLSPLTKKKFQTTRLQRPHTVSHLPHTACLHQPTMLHPQRTTPLQLSTELLQVLTRLHNSTEPRCPRPLTLCIMVKSLLLKRPLPPGPI